MPRKNRKQLMEEWRRKTRRGKRIKSLQKADHQSTWVENEREQRPVEIKLRDVLEGDDTRQKDKYRRKVSAKFMRKYVRHGRDIGTSLTLLNQILDGAHEGSQRWIAEDLTEKSMRFHLDKARERDVARSKKRHRREDAAKNRHRRPQKRTDMGEESIPSVRDWTYSTARAGHRRWQNTAYEIGGKKGQPTYLVQTIRDPETSEEFHRVVDQKQNRVLGVMHFALGGTEKYKSFKRLTKGNMAPTVSFTFESSEETIPLQTDVEKFGELNPKEPVKVGLGKDGLYVALRDAKGQERKTAAITLDALYNHQRLGSRTDAKRRSERDQIHHHLIKPARNRDRIIQSGKTEDVRNRSRLEIMGGVEPPPETLNPDELLVDRKNPQDGRFRDGSKPVDRIKKRKTRV